MTRRMRATIAVVLAVIVVGIGAYVADIVVTNTTAKTSVEQVVPTPQPWDIEPIP